MANAAEIADLITQGIRPPQGSQDVSYHTGVIKSWDPTSGVNVVEVNGVLLSNLTGLQNGMGVAYLPGDVVSVVRVQTKYTILGRMSAPNGLSGGPPQTAQSGGTTDIEGATIGAWNLLNGQATITSRIGNSCLVMFGARSTNRNTGVSLGLWVDGPATLHANLQGSHCYGAMDNGATNGPIISSDITAQIMFYRGTSWNTDGVPQLFQPGVYTFTLKGQLSDDFSGGNTAIRDAKIVFPWLTVIPF